MERVWLQGISKKIHASPFNRSSSELVTRILSINALPSNVDRRFVTALQRETDSYVIHNDSFCFLGCILIHIDKI